MARRRPAGHFLASAVAWRRYFYIISTYALALVQNPRGMVTGPGNYCRRRMTLEVQLTTKDDFLRQHDDDPLEAQQYVLPLASARAHSSRVEALPSAFTERTLCRCAWFPRCNKRVWDCGGIRKTSCHRIRGGYETPSGEVFKRRRKEALFTDRAERR